MSTFCLEKTEMQASQHPGVRQRVHLVMISFEKVLVWTAGSSSGSAVAVASRVAPFALCEDTGGKLGSDIALNDHDAVRQVTPLSTDKTDQRWLLHCLEQCLCNV